MSAAFDRLAAAVAKEYRSKGMAPARAAAVGRAVAGQVATRKRAAATAAPRRPAATGARPKASRSAATARRRPPNGGKPSGGSRTAGNRRNPDTLAYARRASRTFHGAGAGDLIELSPAERRLPRYVVPLGAMPELEYQPARGKRAGWNWRHKSGDRGTGQPKSKRRPILAADPTTGRPIIVQQGSPMRFTRTRGLVG